MRRLASDTLIIAERNLIRLPRAPELLIAFTVQPIMFVLLFRYVFGGAISTPGYSYVDFLLPGIIVQNTAFGGGRCHQHPVAHDPAGYRRDHRLYLPHKLSSRGRGRRATALRLRLLLGSRLHRPARLLAGNVNSVGFIVILAVFVPLAVARYRRAAGG
jgi:hypothetical protein